MRLNVTTRRIATWLAVVGYALVASGLPLPMGTTPPPQPSAAAKRLAGKDRTTPFPCMDRPCGCATAEQCFSSCCCNTPSQTLAWAKAHRVDSTVIAALERRVAAAAPPAASVAATCCLARKQASCCSAATSGEAVASTALPLTGTSSRGGACPTGASRSGGAEVCSEYRSLGTTKEIGAESSATDEPVEDASHDGPSGSRTVVLRSMLACGGIAAEWFVAGASLPPPRFEVVHRLEPIDRVAVVDEAASCPRAAPAAPPPRAA